MTPLITVVHIPHIIVVYDTTRINGAHHQNMRCYKELDNI